MRALGPLLLRGITDNSTSLTTHLKWVYIVFDENAAIKEIKSITPAEVDQHYNGTLPTAEVLPSNKDTIASHSLVLAPFPSHNEMYLLVQNTHLERFDFAFIQPQADQPISLKNFRALPKNQIYSQELGTWLSPKAKRAAIDYTEAYYQFYSDIQNASFDILKQYKSQIEAQQQLANEAIQLAESWQTQREKIETEKLYQMVACKVSERPILNARQINELMNIKGFLYNWQILKTMSGTKEQYCQDLKDILEGNVDLNNINKNNAALLRPYFFASEINRLNNRNEFYLGDMRDIKLTIGDVYQWQCELLKAEHELYSNEASPAVKPFCEKFANLYVGELKISNIRTGLDEQAISLFLIYQSRNVENYMTRISITQNNQYIEIISQIFSSNPQYWQLQSDFDIICQAAGETNRANDILRTLRRLFYKNIINNDFCDPKFEGLKKDVLLPYINDMNSSIKLIVLLEILIPSQMFFYIRECHQSGKFISLFKDEESRKELISIFKGKKNLNIIDEIAFSLKIPPSALWHLILFNDNIVLNIESMCAHIKSFSELISILEISCLEIQYQLINTMLHQKKIDTFEREQKSMLAIFDIMKNNHLFKENVFKKRSFENINNAYKAIKAFIASDIDTFTEVINNINESDKNELNNLFSILAILNNFDFSTMFEAFIALQISKLKHADNITIENELSKIISSLSSTKEIEFLLKNIKQKFIPYIIKQMENENKFSLYEPLPENNLLILSKFYTNDDDDDNDADIESEIFTTLCQALNIPKDIITIFKYTNAYQRQELLNDTSLDELEKVFHHLIYGNDQSFKQSALSILWAYYPPNQYSEDYLLKVFQKLHDFFLSEVILNKISTFTEMELNEYIANINTPEQLAILCSFQYMTSANLNNSSFNTSAIINKALEINQSYTKIFIHIENIFRFIKFVPYDYLSKVLTYMNTNGYLLSSNSIPLTKISQLFNSYFSYNERVDEENKTIIIAPFFIKPYVNAIGSSEDMIILLEDIKFFTNEQKGVIVNQLSQEQIETIVKDPTLKSDVSRLSIATFDAIKHHLSLIIQQVIFENLSMEQIVEYVCINTDNQGIFSRFPEKIILLSENQLETVLNSTLFDNNCKNYKEFLNYENLISILTTLPDIKKERFIVNDHIQNKIKKILKSLFNKDRELSEASTIKLTSLLKSSELIIKILTSEFDKKWDDEQSLPRQPYLTTAKNFPWDLNENQKQILIKFLNPETFIKKIKVPANLTYILNKLPSEDRKTYVKIFLELRGYDISPTLQRLSLEHKELILEIIVEHEKLAVFKKSSNFNQIQKNLFLVFDNEILQSNLFKALISSELNYLNTLDKIIYFLQSDFKIISFSALLNIVPNETWLSFINKNDWNISQFPKIYAPNMPAILEKLTQQNLVTHFFKNKINSRIFFSGILIKPLNNLLTSTSNETITSLSLLLMQPNININFNNIFGNSVLEVPDLQTLIKRLPVSIKGENFSCIHDLNRHLLAHLVNDETDETSQDKYAYSLWMVGLFQAKSILQNSTELGADLLSEMMRIERNSKSFWPIHHDEKGRLKLLVNEINTLADKDGKLPLDKIQHSPALNQLLTSISAKKLKK